MSIPTISPTVCHAASREATWSEVTAQHYRFSSAHCEHRFGLLGEFFEVLVPWLERGIRGTLHKHFLVLPEELLVARLFAAAARRDQLHATDKQFLQWIESQVLASLANPADELGSIRCAYGTPDLRLQYHFNRLPKSERALLFLFMVEHFDVARLAKETTIPREQVSISLYRAWNKLIRACPHVRFPSTWKLPKEGLSFLEAEGNKR
jgi:hypothetical protein